MRTVRTACGHLFVIPADGEPADLPVFLTDAGILADLTEERNT